MLLGYSYVCKTYEIVWKKAKPVSDDEMSATSKQAVSISSGPRHLGPADSLVSSELTYTMLYPLSGPQSPVLYLSLSTFYQ